MSLTFPIAYFEDNLIFSPDKRCWAAYEVNGYQYDFKSIDQRKRYFKSLLGLFWNMQNAVKLLIVPEEHSFTKHFERLKARATGPFVPFANCHADSVMKWLKDGLGESGSKSKMFILANLDQPKSFKDELQKSKESLKSLFLEPKRKTEEFVGLSGLEFFEDEIQALKEIEERVYTNIAQFLRVKRIKESRIDWLIRRNFWKGISQPPKRYIWQEDLKEDDRPGTIKISSKRRTKDVGVKNGKKFIRPRHSEFLSLTEGEINLVNRRMVKTTQLIRDQEVSSYSAYLTVCDIPDDIYIPGDEYIYQLNDLGFPVGVSIYASPIPFDDAQGKVRSKKMEIDDQTEHTGSVKDLPLNLVESKREALWLEKDLDDNKFPMLDVSFTFEIVGKTEKEVYKRMDILKSFYKGMKFTVVNPSGEQWPLFNEFMPAGVRYCSPDYVHRVPPHFLAASMFGATKQLGDDEGFYIGTTGFLNQPVFFDPARGPRINRSGSGAILGSLGGGKSYTANYICYLCTLYGAKTLIFDPKGDRLLWGEYLKEFEGQIDYVTLSDREEDYGKLDPWGMLEPNEAAKVAINIITFLANINTDHEAFPHLITAVEKVKLMNKRSMMQIVNVLESMPEEDAKRLALRIRAFSSLPNAKLIFFDGLLQSISTEKRITILNVANLDLPPEGTPRSDYDTSQVLAISLMFSITAFATKFTEEDPNEFTIVVLDEFWALSGTKEGKRLATRLIRTGRSFYAAIFLITQNADDLLDEKIKNNLGFKFVFRSGDNKEVLKILEFLDLEPTEANIEMIKNIENGKPLFQDLNGHCGIVDIDVVFDHIHQAFDTTPGKKKKEEVVEVS